MNVDVIGETTGVCADFKPATVAKRNRFCHSIIVISSPTRNSSLYYVFVKKDKNNAHNDFFNQRILFYQT